MECIYTDIEENILNSFTFVTKKLNSLTPPIIVIIVVCVYIFHTQNVTDYGEKGIKSFGR